MIPSDRPLPHDGNTSPIGGANAAKLKASKPCMPVRVRREVVQGKLWDLPRLKYLRKHGSAQSENIEIMTGYHPPRIALADFLEQNILRFRLCHSGACV